MNIAYLGIPGSYSYLASKNYYGEKSNMIGMRTFEDIFAAVSRRQAMFGVVPLENTISGSIYQTYDLLINSKLKIVGEIIIKLKHCLLVKKSLTGGLKDLIGNLTICYSHPEVLKHCHNFFIKNFHLKPVYSSDTATAAKFLNREKGMYASAISNSFCANLYGLRIVSDNIQDNLNNYTRFVIIGREIVNKGEKVSIVFSLEHKPGSLVRALESYAKLGFNLTKIESRPIVGKPWEYMFLVDLEIPGREDYLPLALKNTRKNTIFLKVLGRYKRGAIYEP